MPLAERRPRLGFAQGGWRPSSARFPSWLWPRADAEEGATTNEMSAVPTDIALAAEPGNGRDDRMPLNAKLYFALVAVTAIAVTAPFVGRLQHAHDWTAFLVLGSAAAVARLFVVRTPADQAYHTDIVFLIP